MSYLTQTCARLFQSPLYICVTNYTRPVVRIGFASLNREIESQLDVMDEVTVEEDEEEGKERGKKRDFFALVDAKGNKLIARTFIEDNRLERLIILLKTYYVTLHIVGEHDSFSSALRFKQLIGYV